MTAAAVIRASVTAEAGGTNLCPNPGPAQDVSQWAAVGAVTPPTVVWTTAQPDANPIGDPGCGLVTWQGPDSDNALSVPSYSILSGSTNTVSLFVYVPDGSPTVHLTADSTSGASSGSSNTDQWFRVWLTFTATEDDPLIYLYPDSPPNTNDPLNPQQVYFAGCLIQPGVNLDVFVNGGGQDGDPVQVLTDGSDTPITANGLTGYTPTPGDRLLVMKIGGLVEVLQFVSRGTVPYLVGQDLSDLQAQVNANGDDISTLTDTTSATDDTLANYMADNDLAVGGLQNAYDGLSGIGSQSVTEDYFWVGDDPSLSTTKLVQISTYVQNNLYVGDSGSFAAAFGLYSQADIGDITYSGSMLSPKTEFYTYLNSMGITVVPI